MQYTNDGMYVVDEKGVSSLCCEECNAIYLYSLLRGV